MSGKSFLLGGIELDEVSLVDIPANQEARIAIWKKGDYKGRYEALSRAQKVILKRAIDEGMDVESAYAECAKAIKGGSGMDPKELAAKLEALETQVTDLTKSNSKLATEKAAAETALAELTKAADAEGFDVEGSKLTKRADPEMIEIGGEMVAKSAIHPAVLKQMEADRAAVVELQKAADVEKLAKSGKAELPHLAGTDIAKGKLFAAADDDMRKVLKAADVAMAKAAQELGSADTDDTSASARLNKMAQDIAAAESVPFETAFAKAASSPEGMALYREATRLAN